MSNTNRDYAIIYDVKNSSLILSRPLIFYITDKNTSNIFVRLVAKINIGDGIDQYTDIENASEYILLMRTIKPNDELINIKATQHEPESVFEFDLTDNFKDIPGTYICELMISTIVNGRQELLTSDSFTYEVKRSVLSRIDEIIEHKDTTVEKLLNDLDATKAELSSQLAIERERINNIIALPEGSTTNDARLEDICIGINSNYSSPGESVRGQITDVYNKEKHWYLGEEFYIEKGDNYSIYLKFDQIAYTDYVCSWDRIKRDINLDSIFTTSPNGKDNCLKLKYYEMLIFDIKNLKFKVINRSDINNSIHVVIAYNCWGRLESCVLASLLSGFYIYNIKDIENNTKEIKLLKEKYPSYYEAQLTQKINETKTLQERGGAKAFSFAFITDIHLTSNSKNSFKLLEEIDKKANLRTIITGGDWVNNSNDKSKVIDQMREINYLIHNYKNKTLHCVGNHDDNTIKNNYNLAILPNEMYANMFNFIEGEFNEGKEEGLYYYKDDTKNKVRYIVLNSQDIRYIKNSDNTLAYKGQWDYAFRQHQLLWFSNVALNVPSPSWAVIVISHIPPIKEGVVGSDRAIANADVAWDILTAFKNKTSYTSTPTNGEFGQSISVNFTGKGGDVICWLSGHVHADNIIDKNGIKLITTLNDSHDEWEQAPARPIGTVSEQAFDIITVNKAIRQIKIKRIGAGEDREITY